MLLVDDNLLVNFEFPDHNYLVNFRKFIQEYQDYLKSNFNPERAEKEKAYFYSDLKHYGVSVWERRKFVVAHKKEIAKLSKKDTLDLVRKFWQMPYFEERDMALSILELHSHELDIMDMSLVENLMRESKGWAFLDSLIIPLMPVIIKKDKEAYGLLKKWIKDNDFWVRRSALLSQLLFFRSGQGGDRELFFDMAKSQFDEAWIDEVYKDKLQRSRARFFIRKAIGWTLREMSAKNPEVVYKFLLENKPKMSGLSFREGSRKLPQDLKTKLSSQP